MKKAIILTLGVAGILLIAYYVIPNNSTLGKVKAQVSDFITGRTIEIKNSFKDIAPKSQSQKDQKELLGELKENLNELKDRVDQKSDKISEIKNEIINLKASAIQADNNEKQPLSAQSTQEIIQNTEKLINTLEENNNSQSAIQRITDKILDVVLPVKETETDCPPNN